LVDLYPPRSTLLISLRKPTVLFEFWTLCSGLLGMPYKFRDSTEGYSVPSSTNGYAFQLLRHPSLSKKTLMVTEFHLHIFHCLAKLSLQQMSLKLLHTKCRYVSPFLQATNVLRENILYSVLDLDNRRGEGSASRSGRFLPNAVMEQIRKRHKRRPIKM
jgi:hypothetical protein